MPQHVKRWVLLLGQDEICMGLLSMAAAKVSGNVGWLGGFVGFFSTRSP